MSEFEKAQILHDLKSNFNVSSEIFDSLLTQITDSKIKNNFDRITKGLGVEDYYKIIFSSFPWVKNINGLHQQQEKRHKEKYQAPDYILFVENSQKKNFTVLVDVKSVSNDKKTCKLILKQIKNLKQYASDNNAVLLIAIYWEKYGYFTHNCLSHFNGNKKNKISIEDAVKNDMSHFLSDYTFIINKPFFRKTYFSESDSNGARHEEYGPIEKIFIGQSESELDEYSIFESAIVDSIFTMTPIRFENNNNNNDTKYQIERFDRYPMMIKLSNWLVNFLNTTNLQYNTRINDVLVTEYARIAMVNLMHKLDYNISYQLPPKRNKCTDKIFHLAYKDTWLENQYLNA